MPKDKDNNNYYKSEKQTQRPVQEEIHIMRKKVLLLDCHPELVSGSVVKNNGFSHGGSPRIIILPSMRLLSLKLPFLK
jgi:hypothetical protein